MNVRKHIRPREASEMAMFLLANASHEGECLVMDNGASEYPHVQFKGVSYNAHNFVYAALVGPVPEGADVHHTCENKCCIRLDHLEPLTRKEHRQHHGTPHQSLKTHCPQGHPYTLDNLLPSKTGRRACRECNRVRAREYQRKKVERPKAA